jgi:hypothetical protein
MIVPFGRCSERIVGYVYGMHLRRGYLGWGVFLIVTGAVPLLVRSGYLDGGQLDRVWELWPLILVGIGVGLLLRRTRFDFVGGLIVAATLGLMVGGLLSNGASAIAGGGCGSDGATSTFPARDGSLTATNGTVEIELDCGALAVDVGAGTGWKVQGRDDDAAGPEVSSDADSLSVKSRHGNAASWWVLNQRSTWDVTIPDTPRLDLDLQLNAGSSTVDLGGATIREVDLQVNAGSATIDLTDVKAIEGIGFDMNAGTLALTLPNLSMTGSIHANAGAVKLCAPAGVALRLETGSSLISSYDYDGHGLVQDGTTWTTPGFDTASVRIDLRTEANAGSFVLDPEGGCD